MLYGSRQSTSDRAYKSIGSNDIFSEHFKLEKLSNVGDLTELSLMNNVGGTTSYIRALVGKGTQYHSTGGHYFTGSAIHVLDVADMPDYVFADTFRLRPLREVESYIRQHSHLPEVPSATDFRAKGMNMLDMDRLLLKKVEELTLYAIEQEKRLERLETTVELQNKRIEILSKSISGR